MNADDPTTPSQSAARAIVRRAHVEAHDVYVPDESRVDASLNGDCTALFRELRFDDGIARARRDEGWAANPEARLYAAIGLHYQRRYDAARAEYAAAMALSDDASFRGTCAANGASAWFEEGDLARADDGYAAALVIDPLNEYALLGRVAVACQRADADAVVDAAAALRARWPAWQGRSVLRSALLKDRSLRFVRDEPGLFERAMHASLVDLALG